MVQKIKKVLHKKNEEIIVDLYIKDYDKSNFYFALVFNKKVEKFKVLYVPIDAINEGEDVEEYFCYQFVFLHTVNYLLETIDSNKELCSSRQLELALDDMEQYYIEMNTYVDDSEYKFTFTQFISNKFKFLFDVVVALFEHSPNIVSELGKKILSEFNENYPLFKYTGSFEFDLENDSLENLFGKKIIDNCKYSVDDIEFIENMGNRNFAVIKGNLVVVDYFPHNNIVNVSTDKFDTYGEEIFIILKAIKSHVCKKFYRLMVDSETSNEYYLCYGFDEDRFKIINSIDDVDYSILTKKNIKVLESDEAFENQVRERLSKTYVSNKVDKIMKDIIMGRRED